MLDDESMARGRIMPVQLGIEFAVSHHIDIAQLLEVSHSVCLQVQRCPIVELSLPSCAKSARVRPRNERLASQTC